jgi:hypothetical protein
MLKGRRSRVSRLRFGGSAGGCSLVVDWWWSIGGRLVIGWRVVIGGWLECPLAPGTSGLG